MPTKVASSLREFELVLTLVTSIGPKLLCFRLPTCFVKMLREKGRWILAIYHYWEGSSFILRTENMVQIKPACLIVVEYLDNRRSPSSSKCDSSILLAKAECSVL